MTLHDMPSSYMTKWIFICYDMVLRDATRFQMVSYHDYGIDDITLMQHEVTSCKMASWRSILYNSSAWHWTCTTLHGTTTQYTTLPVMTWNGLT